MKFSFEINRINKNLIACIIAVALSFAFLCGCDAENPGLHSALSSDGSFLQIPQYTGDAYTVLNNNIPCFSKSDYSIQSFEEYGDQDFLGRCTYAFANLCEDTMPDEPRDSIGMIKPSGWQISKYDFVDGKYLYNRCHLIGFQLSGENANEKNLVTGTRYMNTVGMLRFENKVADYVKKSGNHVLYRVTPVFEGNELVCRGVVMEAYSVEDNGAGISFNVFCHNVQPGVEIDYLTGNNKAVEYSENNAGSSKNTEEKSGNYILNKSSKKIHTPQCASVKDMKEKNKKSSTDSLSELIKTGYKPCGSCKPQ